jgi:hypothetical protein
MNKVMKIGDVVIASVFGAKWRGMVDEVFAYEEEGVGNKRFHAEATDACYTPAGKHKISAVEDYVDDYEWDSANHVWMLRKEGKQPNLAWLRECWVS